MPISQEVMLDPLSLLVSGGSTGTNAKFPRSYIGRVKFVTHTNMVPSASVRFPNILSGVNNTKSYIFGSSGLSITRLVFGDIHISIVMFASAAVRATTVLLVEHSLMF